jgi:uncharacterized membrane protein
MAIAYSVAFIIMALLDALWLGVVARDFYRQEIGELMAAEVNKLPAALFYVGYPAGLVMLALHPAPDSVAMAAWRSALVGLVAYGTYDLTNLATLRHWSVTMAIADIAWGTLASALAGTAAFYAMKRAGL